MLGEFKSDQFFVQKTKLADNLCVCEKSESSLMT